MKQKGEKGKIESSVLPVYYFAFLQNHSSSVKLQTYLIPSAFCLFVHRIILSIPLIFSVAAQELSKSTTSCLTSDSVPLCLNKDFISCEITSVCLLSVFKKKKKTALKIILANPLPSTWVLPACLMSSFWSAAAQELIPTSAMLVSAASLSGC